MSVTETIENVQFYYRILSSKNRAYIKWNMKELPDLFNGIAYSHEEKVEQWKQAIKELRKLNRNKTKK
jgi:flavorubredoxin|tara:strand:- start:620 stop:823 length:204 start_codon:yes stop_codon:yes gene_type:complete